MKSLQNIIVTLENNIEQLLERYEFLQKENQILSNSNFVLQQNNKSLEGEVSFYKEQLHMLKIAKTIEGSEGYKKDTKAKIDFLVAEIDQCIKELST